MNAIQPILFQYANTLILTHTTNNINFLQQISLDLPINIINVSLTLIFGSAPSDTFLLTP